MSTQKSPKVNAGSMADIAFLLLIFFLVTTTIETDHGINRKLSPIDTSNIDFEVRDRNLLTVLINANGELLVEDNTMQLKELKHTAITFLDNGGGIGEDACTYCKGAKEPTLSVNPEKAVITIQNDRLTKYSDYIAVQNELLKAYEALRDREANRLYNTSFQDLQKDYKDEAYKGNKQQLKKQIDSIKHLFPQKLSEAEPKKTSV